MNPLVLATLVFGPLVIEAVVSRRNERELRALGASEPPGDVYHVMQLAYPAAFLAMLAEGAYRGGRADTVVASGFALFVGAKLLKYWAIMSLGPRWTFRVLVPPGASLIVLGPYRLLRHPNYVAVMGELAGVALMAHAMVAGICALAVFAVLVRRRIIVEERALGLRAE